MNLKKPLLQPIWDKDPYGEAYFFSECHASGMVDDLNIQTRENGFVAWSAGWHESSWSGEDASGKILSWTMALADGFESGLTSTYSLANYAMLNDYYEQNGTNPKEHPGLTGDNLNIITNEPVTEPTTMLLYGIGLLGAADVRRFRNR
jgi:hypothetical protein